MCIHNKKIIFILPFIFPTPHRLLLQQFQIGFISINSPPIFFTLILLPALQKWRFRTVTTKKKKKKRKRKKEKKIFFLLAVNKIY